MGRDEYDLLNFLDALWEHYCFTQHPEALAYYIELGGVIDDDVRKAIVTRLLEGPPKNKGGRDKLRDVKVYMTIKSIRYKDSSY